MIASSLRPHICRCFLGLAVLALLGCGQKDSSSKTDEDATSLVTEWTRTNDHLEFHPLLARTTSEAPLFSRLNGQDLGVEFQNLLKREHIKNYLTSGAGLTIGDYDQNGLPDLFLVSQDGPNKLFRQISPWVFEDITTKSGIGDTGAWGAGAAFVDFDNDGDLDLYVCNKGALDEVYVNQGDGTFAGNYFGNAESSQRAPTMAAFCDYDLDGDLDFYRTETRLRSLQELYKGKLELVQDGQGLWHPGPKHQNDFEILGGAVSELGTRDFLFENINSGTDQLPQFSDVTKEAGISMALEHGLAAVWWDYNNDHYPDLYISNDFHTPDHLYLNNRDGTFREQTEEALPYTSWSSMGSDFADINNDGWFDYLSTDMSATTHFKQKTMMGAMTATAWFLDNLEPRQYMRNAMQVNTGTGRFIDTAFYSGLDSTDWTWSGIFGDLNNDGWEDAFFTNGIERNFQDSDLVIKIKAALDGGASFEEAQEILLNSPRFQEKNLSFQNLKNLRFESTADLWGLGDLTVSHGAVFSDIDRDGDLDLVVNNMNEPVGIYRNNSSDQNSILVTLQGTTNNHFGLGARITVSLDKGQTLSRFVTSSRGYMSGAEPVTHFGLGKSQTINELKVTWPGGAEQVFSNLQSQRHYRITELKHEKALAESPSTEKPLFVAAQDNLGIDFEHSENYYDDFSSQPLLPNRLSRYGPALAAGDANGDGLADIFVGAAANRAGKLYLQQSSGLYQELSSPALDEDSTHEDVAATWFDADGDSDLDLYVVSGGASEPEDSQHYADRLYLNDGRARFVRAPAGVLPEWHASGSCVSPCDFDGDGDIDLFIGSRFVPKAYPTPPTNALLMNNGGTFTLLPSPVTSAGLVTGAVWADLDQDQRPDLALSTEWGPIRLFRNTPDGLVEFTEAAGTKTLTGWWNCISTGDFDQDGDLDLVAGNFGLNTKYHVDSEHPATLFAADFGNKGELQLVEAKCKDGKLLPVRGRSCSTSAMPHLLKKAPTYTTFAQLSLQDLYTPEALDEAHRLEAKTLATTIFWNNGNGTFKPEALPPLSQLAPVMSIAVADFTGDGVHDLVLGQNFNATQRETGRMNAGLGVFLKGSKNGTMTELWPANSGLTIRSDTRDVIATDLNGDQKLDLIWGNNNEPLHLLLRSD